MVKYNDFCKTNNHSYNLYNAIRYCKENQEDTLVFDKGKYEFFDDLAAETVLCVSNHDIYGIKRVAFLIDEMDDFCIDGGGSEFIFHGSLVPFAIKNSKNITLKNFSVDIDEVMTLDTLVTAVTDEYFEVLVVNDEKYCVEENMLYLYNSYGEKDIFHYLGIRSFGDDKSFIAESKDEFRVFNDDLYVKAVGDKRLRFYNSQLEVKKDMHIITRGSQRYACDIVADNSKNVNIENIILYKSYSMGLLAQKTENITVDKMIVKSKSDSLFSLNTDVTHFVHCKGKVTVKNSEFSEQQDDALNIHGVFTRITDKGDDYILIKYMHKSAKGLNIYEPGDEIAVLNPKTLIANGVYKIKAVEVINLNYTKLYLDGRTENINVGDDVEDLTWSCDLEFVNNKVTNNRARGILIAAKGKVEIKNNYFNTPGVAILFESDGEKWFESGGTNEVSIENNIFDNCAYSRGWGDAVISVKPREEFNGRDYYHKYISVKNNKFNNNTADIIHADNIEKIQISENIVKGKAEIKIADCKEVNSDILVQD